MYNFVDAVHPDDYCVVCQRPARDPQQSTCECAKLYCKSCYDQTVAHVQLKRIAQGIQCPSCGQALNAFSDKRTAKRINEYKIKCTSTNCPWVDQLKLFDDHLAMCGYAIVPCANVGCKASITRDNALAHQTKECLLRQYACEHCGGVGIYQEMTGAHLIICPDYMIHCPNIGCKVKIKRKETDSHRSECQWEIINCQFLHIGCIFKCPRNKMADHRATSTDYHLELSVAQLMKQNEQQEEQKRQLTKQNEQQEEQKRQLTKQNEQQEEQKRQLKKQYEQQEEQRRQLTRQNEELVKQKTQFDAKQVELTRTIVTLEQEKPHSIKMTNFSRFKKDKAVWHSEGFYTHLHGYKLCLRVDANGNDDGEGKFVSVYLCLTVGEFDKSLPWAISCECTITLINQLKDDNHHSGTFAVTIQKLAGAREILRGYHQFISYDSLKQHALKQCSYLMDDTLHFKVQMKFI